MKTLRYRLDSCERILRQLALVSLWLVCTGPAESQTTMAKYAGNPIYRLELTRDALGRVSSRSEGRWISSVTDTARSRGCASLR